MGLTVKLRGQYVATFRYLHVHLMETLAAWVPTTPEMEAKLLFGEHIWDCAQHADAFGRRTHELRLPLQHSIAPAQEYVDLLLRLRAIAPTSGRVAAIYEVTLPAVGARYRRYLADTDALMDAPTVRIIERIFADHARMQSQYLALLDERPDLRHDDAPWRERLSRDEAGLTLLAAEDVAAAVPQT